MYFCNGWLYNGCLCSYSRSSLKAGIRNLLFSCVSFTVVSPRSCTETDKWKWMNEWMTECSQGTISSSLSNRVRHWKFLMEHSPQPFQRRESKSVSLTDNTYLAQNDGKASPGEDDGSSLGLVSLNIKWKKAVFPSFCLHLVLWLPLAQFAQCPANGRCLGNTCPSFCLGLKLSWQWCSDQEVLCFPLQVRIPVPGTDTAATYQKKCCTEMKDSGKWWRVWRRPGQGAAIAKANGDSLLRADGLWNFPFGGWLLWLAPEHTPCGLWWLLASQGLGSQLKRSLPLLEPNVFDTMWEIKFVFNHSPYLVVVSLGEQKGGWVEGWRNGMSLTLLLCQ